jgi:hypothetical protein
MKGPLGPFIAYIVFYKETLVTSLGQKNRSGSSCKHHETELEKLAGVNNKARHFCTQSVYKGESLLL